MSGSFIWVDRIAGCAMTPAQENNYPAFHAGATASGPLASEVVA